MRASTADSSPGTALPDPDVAGAEAVRPGGPDDRISVLYVIWSLQMGGAERVVYDLARKLDRRRFRPMVCCLNFRGRLADELEKEGIRVYALDKKPKLDASVLVKLWKLMRRERVDVVHTHLWTSSFWGRLAALLARVPVVVITEHNLDTWRRTPHFLADRLLGAGTDHWIFVSDEVKAFYRRRLRLGEDDFHVVHNGIDLAQFEAPVDPAQVKQAMGLPAGKRVVGVVGRLEERKGHRFFVDAMKILLARHPDVVGLIVGEGKEMQRLKAQRDALGLQEGVRLLGYWANLAEALGVVDVFVLPSLMEGHPLAILEAMGAGKPVVATTVGGNAEAVEDGVTGYLVPPADPAALADAIQKVLAEPETAGRMGQQARRRLEQRFNLQAAVEVNQDVYTRYCRKNKGGVLAH
jgi:sugar transferase (PEP-CTERM/EpsH1 system associated)